MATTRISSPKQRKYKFFLAEWQQASATQSFSLSPVVDSKFSAFQPKPRYNKGFTK